MKRTPSSGRAKKCVPTLGGGFFCLENMTWFILAILAIGVIYLYYTLFYKPQIIRSDMELMKWEAWNKPPSLAVPSLSDPYIPPLKSVDIRGQPSIPLTVNYPTIVSQVGQPRYGVPSNLVGGVMPVNISTSSADMPYQQIGILTKMVQSNHLGSEPTILPLMGRNLMNGRDKWQYYTVSNTNNSVRLPVSVKGKSCTGEYGCDSIYNGDSIYVEGYDDTFKATVYENGTFRYIP